MVWEGFGNWMTTTRVTGTTSTGTTRKATGTTRSLSVLFCFAAFFYAARERGPAEVAVAPRVAHYSCAQAGGLDGVRQPGHALVRAQDDERWPEPAHDLEEVAGMADDRAVAEGCDQLCALAGGREQVALAPAHGPVVGDRKSVV